MIKLNELYISVAALESSTVGTSTSGPSSTKKRSREKEVAKEAVHARYLMEKYGLRWRMKTAYGRMANGLICKIFSV
jgi:hypothetical protein